MASKKAKATTQAAMSAPDQIGTGAAALLTLAAAAAQPGQEPTLPPPPPDEPNPPPPPDPALDPEPAQLEVQAHAPIFELADACALPDVTHGVYKRAEFDSPLAIRAFKDHDGRSMAVVYTGYTLAKAALND
jgi:hypothetical protein